MDSLWRIGSRCRWQRVNGISIGGLGIGAGGDLTGINLGGLGVGAGENVKGFSFGGLGMGAGENITE